MSLEVKIHHAQTVILRELLFHPSAGFAQLQKSTGLSSDHFNFHIGRLVDLGLVERESKGKYQLTTKGKEYANRLDTDDNTIERQPKTAVILALERSGQNGTEYLFQERLKNPYFGYWGLPSGKIRWGETIVETALRESLEETGLEADFEVAGVYHEHVQIDDDVEMTEDKLFFICKGINVRGDFLEEFEGGRNKWMTFDEAKAMPLRFQSFEVELDMLSNPTWLVEQTVVVEKHKF